MAEFAYMVEMIMHTPIHSH